jgi:chromosome partitioning protein
MRIAVFNQKGGVGKTTSTLNLAAAIARRGDAVRLVDVDPQAHLSSIPNLQPAYARDSLFALYSDNRLLVELVRDWPGIGQLFPAHAELIKVDSIFGKGPSILNKLRIALEVLEAESGATPVLIDCCPFLGVLSLNALFAADALIVPVSSDHMSLRGAQQLERTLKALEPVLKRRMPRRYLLTRFDRRRRMCFDIRQRMQEQFGDDVCTTVISENVAVAEAPALASDIFSYAPASRGAADYQTLLNELTAAGWF